MNFSVLVVLLAALVNVNADDVPNQNTHLYSIPAEPTYSYNESTETGVMSILPITISSHDSTATSHAATTPSTTGTPSASSAATSTTSTTTAGHVVTSATASVSTSSTSRSGSATQSPTSNPAANPTACVNNIVGIVALVGLAVAV